MTKNKFKVCGITRCDEAQLLDNHYVRFLGFIFYHKSTRNAYNVPSCEIRALSGKFDTVGVFVDENIDEIDDICSVRGIKYIQLHGSESPDLCVCLRKKNYKVIKAIPVRAGATIEEISACVNLYDKSVDYFLFDASGTHPGGNGVKFDWNAIKNADISKPFLVGGGIDPSDVEKIACSDFNKTSNFIGWDLNSRFEISPGNKDVNLINEFIEKINDYE